MFSRLNSHPAMFRLSVKIVSLALVVACCAISVQGADSKPSEQAEFFEAKIRPLFAKHCLECHSTSDAKENGELDLESVAGIASGGTRGTLWDGKNVKESLLVEALRYGNPDLQMPPEGKLSLAEINAVEQWIQNGANLPAYKSKPRAHEAGIDYEQARGFWSFKPLDQVSLPPVNNSDWVKQPIDRFILSRLEQEQLAPTREADRRTLVRRVTFDLTGLPPTPEDVEAFLEDDSPEAYERLVERLLDSRHYGERWARFWLDLARYTDTTASWLQSTAQAWHYRDWVIGAFNRNLSYDRFVKLQLAGDLIPETPVEEQTALGFLGLSPTYWKELRLAPGVIKEVVAEEWDERIDAVSRTFLGLTASCARCHDHKFDPITMQDYYGLAGVFASTQLHDRPLLPDEQAEMVRTARKQVEDYENKLKGIKEKASPEAEELKQKIAEVKKTTPQYDAPWIHIVREASIYVRADGTDATRLEYKEQEPRDLPLFHRGNPNNPGEVIPRGFLKLFSGNERLAFQSGSGRRELAESLFTQSESLTARVFVNRIWAEHFGQGLVRTLSNFGTQGERPSHPELLDWLASEFIESEWDIKELHKSILLSATYRQGSDYREDPFKRDPENRLLWRMNRKRLSIEMWRDAMLAVAGNLDDSLGGPAVDLDSLDNHRRTIYGKIARRDLNRMLRMYDFPEPTAHSPRRVPTTTPLQQLFVLNSPFVEQQARALSETLSSASSDEQKIQTAYQRLFSREPSSEETAVGIAFVENSAETDRWSSYLHALLSLNEFLYID